MKTLTVSPATIAGCYESFDKIGCLGAPRTDGFLRASWSKEEEQAIAFVRARAEKAGLKTRTDAVGNYFFEIAGSTPEYVETGSHVDTTVAGGNYDGAGGVLAGLCAIESVLAAGGELKKGLRLRIWRGEESATYSVGCKGSRAAFGDLPKKVLENRFRGTSLREAISSSGFDPSCIENGTPCMPQSEIDNIAAHIELHIEQANALECQKVDIGVVTSIRGPIRWRVSLVGSFDHSGGTPMGVEFRRDANLAFAYLSVELDKLGKEALQAGNDLVQTIGIINSDPAVNEADARVHQNGITKVSGFVYFTLDIRSSEAAFRATYVKKVFAAMEQIAADMRVDMKAEDISQSAPLESLAAPIQTLIGSSADALGYSSVLMPSGGIHDCLYLCEQKKTSGENVPIGMIFIPCLAGRSHCPEEFATNEEIAKGASVLATALYELSH